MLRPASYHALRLDTGIRAAANRAPDKVALSSGQRRMTYRSLRDRIDRVAAVGRHGLGLCPGDRVLLWAGNCVEYIEVITGLAAIGVAVATPSPRLTAAEIAAIVDDCDPRAIFVEPKLRDALPSALHPPIQLGGEYETLLARARPAVAPDAAEEWDTFSIPYTSGTTGKPKGVMLPHRSRTLTFLAMATEYGCYGPDDRALAMAPLCHGAGLAFAIAPIFFGGSCEIVREFEPELVLRRLAEGHATNLFVVPTHLHAFVSAAPGSLAALRGGSLRTIICNAAALPNVTREATIDAVGEGILHETYGSTEAGIVTNLRPADQRRKSGSVGLPFPLNEVELRNEQGIVCAPGAIGELYSRSPMLFAGYWRRAEATAEALHADGWCTAGDLATRDEEGYITIVGRKKDMIISGGINIYPREIEDVLRTHHGVADVAVIGVPDERWGERLLAFIVPAQNQSPSDEELIAHATSMLAGYKVPRHYRLIAALPRDPAGKLLKQRLRALATA